MGKISILVLKAGTCPPASPLEIKERERGELEGEAICCSSGTYYREAHSSPCVAPNDPCS